MDKQKLSQTFVDEDSRPTTDAEWDKVFERAMEIMVDGVNVAIEKADREKVPRQIMIMQLYTIVIDGFIHYNWTKEEAVARMLQHNWPEEETPSMD